LDVDLLDYAPEQVCIHASLRHCITLRLLGDHCLDHDASLARYLGHLALQHYSRQQRRKAPQVLFNGDSLLYGVASGVIANLLGD